jgi:hypothetical protein
VPDESGNYVGINPKQYFGRRAKTRGAILNNSNFSCAFGTNIAQRANSIFEFGI